MTPFDMYKQRYELVDPANKIVSDEIKKGIRHEYGITDVHHHMPLFLEYGKGSVFEIGVRFGTSTCAFLAGVEQNGGHLYSIDTEDCNSLFNSSRWSFRQLDSRNIKAVLEFIPTELDTLFIDGDHSYEGCYSDLMYYGALAKTILVHDCSYENIGVYDAVMNYMSGIRRQKEIRVIPESHGLAILQ